jgi:hypothetical protein
LCSFSEAATPIAQRIIEELMLTEAERSVRTSDLGGQAGGLKVCWL